MQGVATGTALFFHQLQARRGRPVARDEVEPVVWSAFETASRFSGHRLPGRGQHLPPPGPAAGRSSTPRFDLLLTPTLAEPPALLGRFAMDNPDFIDYRLGPQGLWRYTPFCPLANATGAPAISLPVAMSSAGLPIGAMLPPRMARTRCCCAWPRNGRPRAARCPCPFGAG
jgi:amidase